MSRGGNNSVLVALVAAAAATAWPPAYAERADRDKPVNIESDRMSADDARKVATFEGRVVLTQGTLIIRADRLVVRQDQQGFQYGTAHGNPARFRQKREGFDEFIDGEAQRVEYDGRADKVELFERARLRREGGDDVSGNYISYDAKSEFFTVSSSRQAGPEGRDARVRAVIMPRKKESAPQNIPAPLELKPAPRVSNPRQE